APRPATAGPAAADAAPAPGEDGAADRPAGLVIEHHARGTLVHGTSKTDRQLHDILRRHSFKFSHRLDAWYLGKQWAYGTRDRHVRGLRRDLDAIGRDYQLDGQAPAAAQPAPPEPIQPGAPYETAKQADADYRQLVWLYWEARDTSAGKRLLVYAMRDEIRADAAALKGAAAAALDPAKQLTGTPGE